METLTPPSTTGATLLESATRYLDQAAWQIGLDRNIHQYLRSPKRELSASLPVVMDSGNLELFTGYRVQHILAVGPTKGGIRYGPQVDLDTLRALAMANTWKNAVVGLHFGGAEGGVRCDRRTLSDGELERLTRRYASEMNIIMGLGKDIPEPDESTDEQIMAWIMDTYSMDVGFSVPGVVTGKPRSIGGSGGFVETQAWGALYVVREVLKRRRESLKGWRIGLQGISPLSLQLGRLMQAEGARVVAVSDHLTTMVDDQGLNLDEVWQHIRQRGTLGSETPASRILQVGYDAVVLSGGAHTVSRENLGELNVGTLIEMSPSAVGYDLDDLLHRAGVFHIPNILTQAGGVTAQYVEWVQDIQSFFWDDAEVSEKLEYLLTSCLSTVFAVALEVQGNLRMASHMIAVRRVGEALTLRGIYP